MKLSKDMMLEMDHISAVDAENRLQEFKEKKTLEPQYSNYPFEKMKELWPEGQYFDLQNVEGFYGKWKDGYFIMFRGTDSLLGWIRNFMFAKKVIPYEGTNPEIKVHHGFLKNYLAIRENIHKVVKECGHKKIYVHGHSMGAALTTLCALDLQYNFPDIEIGSYVLASPKIGNEKFVESFNKRLPDFVNIEQGSDLIPQVPPRFFGFRHNGQFFHIGKKRRFGIGTHKDHNWWKYYRALTDDIDELLTKIK